MENSIRDIPEKDVWRMLMDFEVDAYDSFREYCISYLTTGSFNVRDAEGFLDTIWSGLFQYPNPIEKYWDDMIYFNDDGKLCLADSDEMYDVLYEAYRKASENQMMHAIDTLSEKTLNKLVSDSDIEDDD